MRIISALAISLTLASAAFASLETMIPTPQEVEALEVTVPIEGGTIVTLDDGSQAQIAADEINARIEELGGQPLPIAADGEGPRIVLSVGDAAPDREQGYAITHSTEGARHVFTLEGHDAQGMLYAAVTFREMLDVEEGAVVIRAANVRDWPDFPLRNLGEPFGEPLRTYYYPMRSFAQQGEVEKAREQGEQHVALMQRYIDWLLRHKINMMGEMLPRQNVMDATDIEREIMRRVTDYGRARGIVAEVRANISIGNYPEDKDNPDFADVAYASSAQRYYCWSRLEYHHAKANAIAQYMKDAGIGALYLHDVDSGSWRDPALWSDRCALCRETYGDDHAKADAVVFGIYYDAIRAAVPDAIFGAVIYPYTPSHLDPDSIEKELRAEMGDVPGVREIAEQYATRNREMLERLNSLVPDDWYICIRENDREQFDLFREVWDPKPFYTYFEYTRARSVHPWFSTVPRGTVSFLYDGYGDILYGNVVGWGFREPLRLYGAQAAWNTAASDPAPFDKEAWNDWRQTQEPRDVAEKWALRTAADLWGEDVAPYMLPLFTRDLSTVLIFDTEEVADRAGISDLQTVMQEQYETAQDCAESMEALFDRILAGEIEPKTMWFGDLTNYYRFCVAAEALAGFKHLRGQLVEAIISGDTQQEEALLEQVQTRIGEWGAKIEQVKERTADLPISTQRSRQTIPKGYLLALNSEELQRLLDEALARRDELAAAYAMPGWFEEFMSLRDFTATRAEAPVTADGVLDEPVWERTEPIEHFTVYNSLRLAAYETVARLAWDETALYVAFECFDPAPEEVQIAPREHDRHEQLDSVEVLLDPNNDDRTFLHWIVDFGGNVFDAEQVEAQDGTLRYDADVDPPIEHAVTRLDDRFVIEMAIPAETLGRAPGSGAWGIHLARNLLHGRPGYESVAARYLDGEGFHAVERFGNLTFSGPEAEPRDPQVTVETSERALETKVHEEGQSTEVRFHLRIETRRSLHHATATARLLDADGEQVAEQVVLESDWIELLHQTRRPLFLEVKRAYEGLMLEVEVTADEGSWTTRSPVGHYSPAPPDEAEMYAPGIEGQALAATMVAPSFVDIGGERVQLLRSMEGTIECWLAPTEDIVSDRYSNTHRTILHIGPIRYDYPLHSNLRSIILFVSKWGHLFGRISNADYDQRTVLHRMLDWKAGQWKHIAWQWRLDDDGLARMQLYVDGVLASEEVGGDQEGDVPVALEKEDEPLAIQVGAMNTGAGPGKMLIDELRFSPVMRYEGPFEAPTRLEADANSSMLFHFDGDLSAQSGIDGVSVVGRPGCAG